MEKQTDEKIIYCDNCLYYKEDDNCCDDLTIGILGIPMKYCSGYKSKKIQTKFNYEKFINDLMKRNGKLSFGDAYEQTINKSYINGRLEAFKEVEEIMNKEIDYNKGLIKNNPEAEVINNWKTRIDEAEIIKQSIQELKGDKNV